MRHDEDRGVDLRVDVDQQLREVGGADRVQTRVGLVDQDDLGVQHERTGQAGALAHSAGDLARELALRTGETGELELLHDDVPDLALRLPGVLA